MDLIESDAQPLMTTAEAAARLSVSPKTLAYWRKTGDGPQFTRLGVRSIRYRREDLFTYIQERQRQHSNSL